MKAASYLVGLEAVGHMELPVDALEVGFDRVEANDQRFRYFLPGAAFGQQPKHLLFLRRKLLKQRGRNGRKPLVRLLPLKGQEYVLEIGAHYLPAYAGEHG